MDYSDLYSKISLNTCKRGQFKSKQMDMEFFNEIQQKKNYKNHLYKTEDPCLKSKLMW